jgi:hypothetical protein
VKTDLDQHVSRIFISVSGAESVELKYRRSSSTGDNIEINFDNLAVWAPEEWEQISADIHEALLYMFSYGRKHEKDMYVTPEAQKRLSDMGLIND